MTMLPKIEASEASAPQTPLSSSQEEKVIPQVSIMPASASSTNSTILETALNGVRPQENVIDPSSTAKFEQLGGLLDHLKTLHSKKINQLDWKAISSFPLFTKEEKEFILWNFQASTRYFIENGFAKQPSTFSKTYHKKLPEYLASTFSTLFTHFMKDTNKTNQQNEIVLGSLKFQSPAQEQQSSSDLEIKFENAAYQSADGAFEIENSSKYVPANPKDHNQPVTTTDPRHKEVDENGYHTLVHSQKAHPKPNQYDTVSQELTYASLVHRNKPSSKASSSSSATGSLPETTKAAIPEQVKTPQVEVKSEATQASTMNKTVLVTLVAGYFLGKVLEKGAEFLWTYATSARNE